MNRFFLLPGILGLAVLFSSTASLADPLSFMDKAAPYQSKDRKLIYPFAVNGTPAARKVNQDIAAELYFDQVLDIAAVNVNAGKDIVGYKIDDHFPNFTRLTLAYWPDGNEETAKIGFLFNPQSGEKINLDEFFNEDKARLDTLKKQFISAFSREKENLIRALSSKKEGKALEKNQQDLLRKYGLDTQDKKKVDLWLESLSDPYAISYYCQPETLSEISVFHHIEWSRSGSALEIDCALKAQIDVNEKSYQAVSWKFSYPVPDSQLTALLSPYGKCLLAEKPQQCAKLARPGIKAGNIYSIKDIDGRLVDLYIVDAGSQKKTVPQIRAVLLDDYKPVTRLFPLEGKNTGALYLRDDYRSGENDLKLVIPYDPDQKKADFSKAVWQKK